MIGVDDGRTVLVWVMCIQTLRLSMSAHSILYDRRPGAYPIHGSQ